MMYVVLIVVAILIALVPWLAYFALKMRFRERYFKLAIFGGIGWFLAMIARTPILAICSIYLSGALIIIIAAVAAGVFEECFRYFFCRKLMQLPITNGDVVSFGIGWGYMEILMTYLLSLVTMLLLVMYNVEVPGVELPTIEELVVLSYVGALERLMVTALHIGFTMFIVQAFKEKKWLLFAIIYHSLVDASTILYYVYGVSIIVMEVVLFLLTLLLYLLVRFLLARNIEEIFVNIDDIFISS